MIGSNTKVRVHKYSLKIIRISPGCSFLRLMCHRHKILVENSIKNHLHAVGMRPKCRTYGAVICGVIFFYQYFAPLEQDAFPLSPVQPSVKETPTTFTIVN